MNKDEITKRFGELAEQRKQVQAKQQEGQNVILSGQQIVEQTNAMLHMINGAEQDCQYWLKALEDKEPKDESPAPDEPEKEESNA